MTFPADNQFTPILLNGAPLFDPPGDESPASTDIVGNSRFPAAYFAYDGINIYFRLRLNGDPRTKTGFQNFAWGLLFDTDGVRGTYEWLLAVNGLNTRLDLIQNTVQQFNSWNDPAEGTDGKGAPNFSRPIVNYDIARARLTGDGSNFGGDPDFFIDFFIPSRTLFSFLGISDITQIRALFFTSANNNNYNKDTLQLQGFSFANSFSDPIEIEDGDVRAELEASKTITSGPTTIVSGTIGEWRETLKVFNVGRSTATTVSVLDRIGLDRVSDIVINQVGSGIARANLSDKAVFWEIGNLPPGQSTTISYTVRGLFNTSDGGDRILNSFTIEGIDQFTGGSTSPEEGIVSITVIERGAVSGRVIDSVTGLPIQGASIEIADLENNTIDTQLSDEGGLFGFGDISPGTYRLNISASNYQTVSREIQINPNETTSLTIRLDPLTSTVQGTVTNEEGIPITNAEVNLVNLFSVVFAQTTTDENGLYTFTNVQPNQYTVTVSASDVQSATRSIIVGYNETILENFTLSFNPSTIVGLITVEGTNAPINNAEISIRDNREKLILTTFTDENGEFSINSLAPGNYRIYIEALGFESEMIGVIFGPGETSNINVSLSSTPGVISGIVRNESNNNTLTGVNVRLIDSSGILVDSQSTDDEGRFSFSNISPGSYTVIAIGEGFSSQVLSAQVRSGETTFLEFELLFQAGILTGRVVDTSFSPIANAAIRVMLNGVPIAIATTNEEGIYIIPDLQPNNYIVSVMANEFAGQIAGATIEAYDTTTLNFELNNLTGTLNGFVRNSEGEPISGATVVVRDSISSNAIYTRRVTDSNGFYQVENLPSGYFLITVYADEFQEGISGAQINSGETTLLDFSINPNPGSVRGTIFNSVTNNPIDAENVEIKIYSVNGIIIATTFVDQNGEYVVPNLSPGQYTIIVSALNFQHGAATINVGSDQEVISNISLTPEPGFINGQIISSTTKEGISGAVVRIQDVSSLIIDTVLTDNEGQFTTNGLQPGQYVVTVQAEGFQSSFLGAFVRANEVTFVQLSLIENPGHILGQVFPLMQGIYVKLFTQEQIYIGGVVTNNNGEFVFSELAPGNYTLVVIAEGFTLARIGALVNTGTTTEISVSLEENPASISGRVTDLEGEPIPNAIINILDQTETNFRTASTDIDGFYSLENLLSGNLTIVVTAENYANLITAITLSPDDQLNNIDFQLSQNSGGISGEAIDSSTGEPISGATVIVRDISGEGVFINSTVTDLFGNFIIEDLAPGNYIVTYWADEYETADIGVTVISDEIRDSSIVLRNEIGSISVEIVDEDGEPITDDNLQVRLFDSAGIKLQTLIASQDGTFQLTNLTPGTYFINVEAPNYAATTSSVQVEAFEATQVRTVLERTSFTLNGVVTLEETGEAVQGSLIVVRDTDQVIISTDVSDVNGEFLIPNLPIQPLIVTVNNQEFGIDSTLIVPDSEEELEIALELTSEVGTVTGYISNITNSEDIAGAVIRIFDETNALVTSIVTDSSGFYTDVLLSPGNYTAIASAEGFSNRIFGFEVEADEESIVSFVLDDEPATIAGNVLDSVSDEPIQGVHIEVKRFDSYGPTIETTLTDENGAYSISGLAPGNYVVIFNEEEFSTEVTATALIRGEEQEINITLLPESTSVRGQIIDEETGTGISNTSIRIIDAQGVVIKETQTTNQGFYVVNDLPFGEVTIVATHPNYQFQIIETLLETEQTIENASLAPNPSVITGVIRDNESLNVIPGAPVELLFDNEIPIMTTITDGRGRFIFTGLTSGEYTVAGSALRYGSVATEVVLEAGEREKRAEILLDFCPGHLRGVVTNEQNIGLGKVRISIFDRNGRLVRSTITNEAGNYSLIGLAPGRYTAEFSLAEKVTETRTFLINCDQFTVLNIMLSEDKDVDDKEWSSIEDFYFEEADQLDSIQRSKERKIEQMDAELFEDDLFELEEFDEFELEEFDPETELDIYDLTDDEED